MDSKQLEALEEELFKDLEAVRRVRRALAAKNGSLSQPDDRQMPLPMNTHARRLYDLDSIGEDDADARPTVSLRAKIAEIINADPAVRWTTQKVLARLQEIHFPLKAKKPIYSVGQSLGSLVESGAIRLVRKGTGSDPNIYRGKLTAGQAETEAPSQATGGDIKTEFVVLAE